MDDKSLNIDIVFRNGLKDLEVLPPPDVWDNIKPVIQKQQRPYIIFRAAALIAVAMSLGFLAYQWSQEVSPGQEEIMQVQNAEQVIAPSSSGVVTPTGVENRGRTVMLSDVSDPAYQPDIISAPGGDLTIQSIDNPLLSNGLQSDNQSINGKYELLTISRPVVNSTERNIHLPDLVPENIEQVKPGRWSISALISPSYHNRISEGNNEAIANNMAADKPVLSYSGGVALSYKINRRFSVQSGLYYSKIGQELSGISAYSGFFQYDNAKGTSNFDVLTASGTVKTSNPDVFLRDNFNGDRVFTRYTSDVFDPVKAELNYIDNSLRQNFSYLELPVFVRYKLVDKTLDFNIVGGISSNLLVSNTVSAGTGVKYQVGETQGLNNITFSSSLGMGMEYNFSDKLSLNLEPTFRYYFNPFGSITGINIHPVSFGIFSGFSYRF
jgi:hypothetical protein